MFKYYGLEVLPVILKCFDVKNIVISGISDKETLNCIFSYCGENNAKYVAIDSKKVLEKNFINDYSLKALPNLFDYDAIFINDDPNWYTVYNELKYIKENNNQFPLVFICNNIFPYTRRDHYIDPNLIPAEFRNDYFEKIDYGCINYPYGVYKSKIENTSRNGVLTAIEDFLEENNGIEFANFKLVNGIMMLYFKSNLNQNILLDLKESTEKYSLDQKSYSDVGALDGHEFNYNIIEDKDMNSSIDLSEDLVNDDELELYSDEISYKNSQINKINSKLSLKDAQIKSIETKLSNRENEIVNLNSQINNLKKDLNNKEISFKYKERELNKKLKKVNSQIDVKQSELIHKNNLLDCKQKELELVKHQYFEQLAVLDKDEYCLSCFKDEINNNHLEIQYLKNSSLAKKFFSPLSYIYLLFKSKPKELFLNFKLYRALKNSKCFNIGHYLRNNEDIQDSGWCKYFSPELHYVCCGFDEERSFNKKYFNKNSKRELLDYILKCNY